MKENNLSLLSKAISDKHVNFVLSDINDHCLRMAVMDEKTYPWHSHPNSDELFLIVEGKLTIEFEEGKSAILQKNDFYKVPAGKIHRTIAEGRTVNLCFESASAETIFLEKMENNK